MRRLLAMGGAAAIVVLAIVLFGPRLFGVDPVPAPVPQSATAPAPEASPVVAAAPATAGDAATESGTGPAASAPDVGSAEADAASVGPAAETAAEADGGDAASADADPSLPPRFDVVRVSPEGQGLIAGRALAGKDVSILLGGEELARVGAEAGGEFVAFVEIAPSDMPRRLSLLADPGGSRIASEEDRFIAPFGLPEVPAGGDADASDDVVAALAAPEPEPAPETASGGDNADADRTADAGASGEPDPDAAEAASADPQVADRQPEGAAAGDDRGSDTIAADGSPAGPAASEAAETAAASGGPSAAPEAPGADAAETAGAGAPMSDPAVAGGEAAPTGESAAPETAPQTASATSILPDADTPPSGAGDIPAQLAAAPEPGPAPARPADLSPPGSVPDRAPAILAADASGVRLVQPPASSDGPPEALTAVSLDTITYDPEGDVVLAGRARGDGFVRVYLDNRPVTSARIQQDGLWRTGLPQVDTGVYTLRIDEVDAAGAVVSRIETPFKREEPGLLAEVLADETAAPGFEAAVRVVQPGNTLWAISRERYGRGILYVEVYAANRDLIRDPDLIYPGQVFRLPEIAPEAVEAFEN